MAPGQPGAILHVRRRCRARFATGSGNRIDPRFGLLSGPLMIRPRRSDGVTIMTARQPQVFDIVNFIARAGCWRWPNRSLPEAEYYRG
jgi:hypothetical protein